MKKLASLFTVLAISVFAIGCGDAEEAPAEGSTPAAESSDTGDSSDSAESAEAGSGDESAEGGSDEG